MKFRFTSLAVAGFMLFSSCDDYSTSEIIDLPSAPTETAITTSSFIDSNQQLTTKGVFGVALGDLDNDGDLDALTVGWAGKTQVWVNDGNGYFTDTGSQIGKNDYLHEVDLADLDGDGDLDAFVGSFYGDRVWFNDGQANFTDSGQSLGTYQTEGVSLGDIDGDGDMDALTGNIYKLNNDLWLNNGSGVFTFHQAIGNQQTHGAILTDMDHDGDLDAVMAHVGRNNNASKIWYNNNNNNNGSGVFIDGDVDLGSTIHGDVEVGDFNADGRKDVLLITYSPNPAPSEVFLNDSNDLRSFTPTTIPNLHRCFGVTTGDFNKDGKLDFVASLRSDDGRAAIYFNDGAGNFQRAAASTIPGPRVNREIAVGDLNRDGVLDLFLATSGASKHQVYFGQLQ